MPSKALHRELNELMGVNDEGMRAQALLDSTARGHGPAHRHDPIHSLGGAIVELAKRGELTPENALAVVAHLNQDKAFDRIHSLLPKGPYREPTKKLLHATLTNALRAARKRRTT